MTTVGVEAPCPLDKVFILIQSEQIIARFCSDCILDY